MADHPTSDSGPNSATPNPATPNPATPGSRSFNLDARRPTGRPVFESRLLPERKRRRFSPWLVVPGLLAVLVVALYLLIFGPKPRRVVNTAGTAVYACDAGSPGVTHLWSVPVGGGAARPLSSGAGADASPTFSADGSQVAFLSSRAGGENQVWLMDGDGKNPLQVTRGGGAKAQPAFAPGSSALLAFLSGASLAVLNVGKGDASVILPAPAGQAARPDSKDAPDAPQVQAAASTVTAFAWQPSAADPADPGLAAVLDTGGVEALAVLPALSAPARLTQNDKAGGPPLAAADAVEAAWAPDGSKMAVAMLHVAGLPANQKASGLIVLDARGNLMSDAQGGTPRPLFAVRDPAVGPQNPVYSPDGSLIAFEVWRQADLASRTRLGLSLIPAGGGPPKILAKGDAGAAQFSRDGASVFFLQRRADGGHDLMREGADGTALVRLSDGRSDVTGFALSPQAVKP